MHLTLLTTRENSANFHRVLAPQKLGYSTLFINRFVSKFFHFDSQDYFTLALRPVSPQPLVSECFSSLPLQHTHNNLATPTLCHSTEADKAVHLKSQREQGWLIYRRTPASSPSLIKAWSERRRRDTQQGRGLIDIY